MKRVRIVLVALCFLIFSNPAEAAIDIFLRLSGIPGESADARHKGDIDITSWQWGMTNIPPAIIGGPSKVSFDSLTLTKRLDKSSPKLMLSACTGSSISEATLFVRKAGGTMMEFVKVTMSGVVVRSVSQTADALSDSAPQERVSLTFARVVYEYVPSKPDGTADTPVGFTWDLSTNP